MCGIAGLYNLEMQSISGANLAFMNGCIAHRGPDDEGYVLIDTSTNRYSCFSGPRSPREIKDRLPRMSENAAHHCNLGLAHSRFSIVDLSAAGHQPFFDSSGQCCAVFNGEIYNYVELRNELKALGKEFRTRSDTEVLVEAYAHWGTDCFERFNGTWALALYDFRSRQLILSRDRLGELPLYWTKVDNTVYFASEIKALLQNTAVADRKQVNERALVPFLFARKRDLDNNTFFEGIYSLPAASWASVAPDFPSTINRFWQLPAERARESEMGPEEAAAAVRAAVLSSVELRMRADVPWCMQLSGGLDSSVLTAAVCQVTPAAGVSTYVVRFPESDEEPFARAVAEQFGCQYYVNDNLEERFWQDMPAFTYLQDEPYVSPVTHVQQLAQRKMSELGKKMFFSGVAGDEIFGGYRSYFFSLQLHNLLHGQLSQFASNARHWTESGNTAAMSEFGRGMWELGEKAAKHAVKQLLNITPRDYYTKTCPYLPSGLALTKFNLGQIYSFDRILKGGITRDLLPYWLRHDDKSMMGIPVEKRCPYLDHNLVELALRVPAGYLIRDGWHKWILRKAFEDLLPAEVVWRRQKLGFPFPDARFRQEHAGRISQLVAAARNPYIDTKLIREKNLSVPVNLMSFLLWYELFFNDNRELLQDLSESSACRSLSQDMDSSGSQRVSL